ncbi:sterol desaturase family protein [Crocinitomix catalasitica]|uniref:sterol desaturase family protein n=1 Tax=Crocinitomix catalasitica TaxID=184607 RepID=UPI00146FC3FC|nr:sterol desaturase family protein [Crocinitomix catalasitica]
MLNEIWNEFERIFTTPFTYIFTDANKRVYYVYLISSIILAYYVYTRAKLNYSFFRYVFNKKIWLNKSAFIDYGFIFFNSLVKILLIFPLLNSWRYLGVHTNDFLEESFGLATIQFSTGSILLVYTFTLMLAKDFIFYLVHLALHKIPFLWEFHKIHHSAVTLNPVTQYRIHPVELFINNASYVFISAITTGVFDYFSRDQISPVLYLGANVFSFAFLLWGANLRHSHVKLKYFSFIEKIFISPYQHQIHHSTNPKHFNKNMGARLAIWDTLFGTLVKSKETNYLKFGLGKDENAKYASFWQNLSRPFVNIFRMFSKRFK